MAAGAVSLKNLTKCEEVRKGADHANYSKFYHLNSFIWLAHFVCSNHDLRDVCMWNIERAQSGSKSKRKK